MEVDESRAKAREEAKNKLAAWRRKGWFTLASYAIPLFFITPCLGGLLIGIIDTQFVTLLVVLAMLFVPFFLLWKVVVFLWTFYNGLFEQWSKAPAEPTTEYKLAHSETLALFRDNTRIERCSNCGARAAWDFGSIVKCSECDYRTWTATTGQFRLEARFGGVLAGKVNLIKNDGSKIQVPLEKLSDTDREWIEQR